MQKEFINIIEQNMVVLAWLSDKLKKPNRVLSRHPRQQLEILVRLHLGGRAKLKDIAAREYTPASNLCSLFRILEKEDLVKREIDDKDRRNTWYSVTPKGTKLALKTIDSFRARISELFSNISKKDEEILTNSLKNMNIILNKIKQAKI
ncbi:MAG: MarR family winged helix-turn-helix transcriptional regulator [Alphaproteobacteria bacterium]|jgi:DNA-binding MarR family transcriptional regulator|nr:winged helix DNA-binding protein [Alphaproteobacteria bacterium]